MKKNVLGASLMLVASLAVAGEYECKVYCVSPSGSTSISVSAGSASEAAAKVDKQSDQVCRAAGFGKSTEATLPASQCRSK